VIDVRGVELADAGDAPGWLVADVDPDVTAAWRAQSPMSGVVTSAAAT
jgi:predicted amidohydrolase